MSGGLTARCDWYDTELHIELPELPSRILVTMPDKRERETYTARTYAYECHDGMPLADYVLMFAKSLNDDVLWCMEGADGDEFDALCNLSVAARDLHVIGMRMKDSHGQ